MVKQWHWVLAEAGADIVGVSATLELSGSAVEKEVMRWEKNLKLTRLISVTEKAVYSFLKKVVAENNAIDILVNNAGTIMRSPAAEHPDEYWDKVMAINLDSQFILAREIGKHMLQRGKGKIIFTCSLLSFQGGIIVPGYTASKSAIAGLVKALANEWAAKGINVNGIAPGYIVY